MVTMVVKKRRKSPEICAMAGCLLVVLLTIAQILVFSQKARSSEQTRTFSGRGLMSEVLTSHASVRKEASRMKLRPISDQVIQARVRARLKANQEVKELERSLAKLIRENSRTPEQVIAEIDNEIYARRISEIIHKAERDILNALKFNNSELVTSQVLLSNKISNALSSNGQEFGQDRINKDHNFKINTKIGPGFKVQPSRNISGSNSGNQVLNNSKSMPLKYSAGEPVLQKNMLRHSPSVVERFSYNDSVEKGKGVGSVEIKGDRQPVHTVDGLQDLADYNLPVCSAVPNTLVGNATDVILNITLTINDILVNSSDVTDGGEWKPPHCTSRHKVAVIIPYRDRWSHLKVLLYYLIPILKRQQIHFRIFVVEQFGNDTFNKGRIMNAAFREALKLFDFHCVTFHDVDLVPEDDRNMYSCTEQPKHMSIGIDKFNYILPYEGLVGGVLMFKTEQFELVNGYSNMYWGWGAEDDDMTSRILHHGLRIYRPPSNIARYKMVKHEGREGSEVAVRMKLLKSAARRSKLEGLNNVQYKLLFTHVEKLFTHFVVDIGHP